VAANGGRHDLRHPCVAAEKCDVHTGHCSRTHRKRPAPPSPRLFAAHRGVYRGSLWVAAWGRRQGSLSTHDARRSDRDW
jgi:hypothetical protein